MLRVLPPLLALALAIYAVVDCVQTDETAVRGLPKIVWVFVILLFPFAGAAAWLLAGRPRTAGPGPRRVEGPRGPDDDPDFLRGL